MKTTLSALTWKLSRIAAALYSHGFSDKAGTMATFCAKHELDPVWTNDAEENRAIRDCLLQLCRPALDAGEADWDVLDLDDQRYAKAFYQPLRKVVDVLTKRQEAIRVLLNIDWRETVTTEKATAVVASAVANSISSDDFEGVLQTLFVHHLRYGNLVAARTLLEEFKPSETATYVCTTGGIPDGVIKEASGEAAQDALNNLGDNRNGAKSLATLEAFVRMNLVTQERVNLRAREIILSDARSGSNVDAHLQKFVGVVVTTEEIDAIHEVRLAQMRASVAQTLSYSDDPVARAARLKSEGIPADEVDAKLKEACLAKIASGGKNNYHIKSLKLPEGLVSKAEITAAFGKYAARLACRSNCGEEWLNDAASHREYFLPGAYEAALLAAVYYGRHGYHATDETKLTQIMADNPTVDWTRLDSLQPVLLVGEQDMRKLVLDRLTDPIERIIGRIIVDWFGNHSSGYDTLSYHFGWLKESMALAVGLPKKKGNDLMDAITQQIDLDFCMQNADEELREIARDLFGDDELTPEVLERHKEQLTQRKEEIRQRKEEVKQREAKEQAVKMARAQRVLKAFGDNLPEVPYTALLNVRQVVTQVIREAASSEIDHK